MAVLDAERARAALGQRLADRFLQYARWPTEEEALRLGIHIDEHVASVRRAAGRREGDTIADLRTADLIASACKRLLRQLPGAPPDHQAAIVGAVRYFLDTHDMERDDEPLGFADDAQVVNYVLAAVAPDLPLIPLALQALT